MKSLLNTQDQPNGAPMPFISNRGNEIRLGSSKSSHNLFKFEYQKNEFLYHDEGPRPTPANIGTLIPPKSFYTPSRRQGYAMVNPRAEESNSYAEQAAKRREINALKRAQDMVDRNNRTGYNVITGDIYGNGPKPERFHNRHIPDGLGPESHSRGIVQLKDSVNRYFLPQESGEGHRRRQEKLNKEGLSVPKMQGVINVGKAEAPSYGLEDQFSKSKYAKTNISGLIETREPGKFTPRKCPENNPSANPKIRSTWTTGVVFSTKYD